MKAAAYARYSTDRQTENSIAYQFTEIERYCSQNAIQIVASYQDEGCSGTNADRAGFQSMLNDAKRGLFDAVVIYDVSRGSRDVGDWFSFRKAMLYLGITVISATGQKLGDLTNGQDFLLELLTVGMGQAEVLGTRQKSIDGVAVKAKEGVFLGGCAPLGYDIVDGHYVINEEEAAVVRKIFSLYADGKSQSYIIDSLHGVLGKKGRPLGKNSLYAMLGNERYIGTYFWNTRKVKLFRKWAGGTPNPAAVRIENSIPAIIDNETWNKVQTRLRNAKRNASNRAVYSYPLSGLMTCSCCGGAYIGRSSTNTRGYVTRYYACGNKYRTRECCSKNINAQKLESFVAESVHNYLMSIDVAETAAQIAAAVNGAAPDLRAEKNELASVTAQINNGVKAILAGADLPELQEQLSRLRARKTELEKNIAAVKNISKKIDPAAVERYLRACLSDWTPENSEQILRKYVQKINAHPDGSCSIDIGVNTIGCGSPLIFLRKTIQYAA